MIVVVDILLSAVFLLGGYVSVCYYLNDVKWDSKNTAVLKPTGNKVLYLLFGILTATVLIADFQMVHHLEWLTQIKLLTLVFVLLPVATIDRAVQKIPNKFLLTALILRAVLFAGELFVSVPTAVATIKSDLLGAVVIGGFFLLMLLIFRNSIGMGDIKLFMVMGLYQGLWGVVNSVFFSLMVSFVVSIILLIGRKKGRNDSISFGPSIALGTIIAIGLAGM